MSQNMNPSINTTAPRLAAWSLFIGASLASAPLLAATPPAASSTAPATAPAAAAAPDNASRPAPGATTGSTTGSATGSATMPASAPAAAAAVGPQPRAPGAQATPTRPVVTETAAIRPRRVAPQTVEP